MPATTMHTQDTHRIHPVRIVLAVLIGIILLTIALLLYRHNHQLPVPTQPTNQMNPNSSQNTPPANSVQHGGNSFQDTTPSSNGTNGQPMSSQ
jgi:4-amino-4-deoxy-L-arabinose transferase-like glycosyltransferase